MKLMLLHAQNTSRLLKCSMTLLFLCQQLLCLSYNYICHRRVEAKHLLKL